MADDSRGSRGTAATKAKDRVGQISSHISSSSPSTTATDEAADSPRRRRRKAATDDGPPADYSDILSQISTLRTMASTPEPSRPGYARQKQAGKLWVRERVEHMFDRGSVREIGSVSGTVEWRARRRPATDDDGVGEAAAKGARPDGEDPESFVPSNNVQGLALVGGRKVCFTADDYSLRAGHADGALWEKTVCAESGGIWKGWSS